MSYKLGNLGLPDMKALVDKINKTAFEHVTRLKTLRDGHSANFSGDCSEAEDVLTEFDALTASLSSELRHRLEPHFDANMANLTLEEVCYMADKYISMCDDSTGPPESDFQEGQEDQVA